MQRYRHLLIPLLLVLITTAVYSEVRNLDFVKWDDNVNIYENPYFNPPTLAGVLDLWHRTYDATYRPLAQTLWAAVASIARLPAPVTSPELGTYQLSPAPFHLLNLLLHLLNALLVFVILRRLFRRGAGAGALLFSVHPLQVETVAWVTGMNDALYTFFGLLALWQYIKFSQPADAPTDGKENETESDAVPVKRAWSRYAVATLFFICALLSKPAAVAIPLVAFAVDYWILKLPLRRNLPMLGVWLAMAAACFLVTRDAHTITNPDAIPPLHLRPLVAGDALAFYLYKLVWPLQLTIDYGRSPGYVLIATHQAYWTWIMPVALGVLLWLGRKRWPVLVAAGAITLLALSPVLGIAPFGFQQYSTVADRYFYFAMLGPAIAVAWLMSRSRGKAPTLIVSVVLLLLCILTPLQVATWKNTRTLFEHTVAVNPESYYAHFALGELAARRDDREAIMHYKQALRINPNSWVSHGQLGFAFERLGDRESAVEEWTQAVQLDPNYEPARKALEIARQQAAARQPR